MAQRLYISSFWSQEAAGMYGEPGVSVCAPVRVCKENAATRQPPFMVPPE